MTAEMSKTKNNVIQILCFRSPYLKSSSKQTFMIKNVMEATCSKSYENLATLFLLKTHFFLSKQSCQITIKKIFLH